MKRSISTLGIVLGILLNCAGAAEEAPTDRGGNGTPASYLKFEARDNNRCQRLWPRGRLLVLFNTHPHKAIRYRLGRVFAGVRQPGFTTGVIEPGPDPHPLGCTLVEGRAQKWVIMQARFVPRAD